MLHCMFMAATLKFYLDALFFTVFIGQSNQTLQWNKIDGDLLCQQTVRLSQGKYHLGFRLRDIPPSEGQSTLNGGKLLCSILEHLSTEIIKESVNICRKYRANI